MSGRWRPWEEDEVEEAMASESAGDICRICFRGQSCGSLVQPCLCRGSIGFAHKPCMERWVSERREERCSICHYGYPIRRKPRTVYELLRHSEGRREPLLYALLGLLFSVSLVHVFALAWLLGVRAPLPWGYRALHGAVLTAQAMLWAIFPFVAFRMAWESCCRWCQANAELLILLPDQPAGAMAKPR